MIQDLRLALRTLLKRPSFTAVAVGTLAIGIGAVTAVFSLVDAVLLEPLPFADPGRLILVYDVQPALDRAPMSLPECHDWQRQGSVFSTVGCYARSSYNLTGDGDPERVRALLASADLLPALGVAPALGRAFAADEEGPGGAPVALLGDAMWRTRFGADPAVLGSTLTLDGEPYTVIGVMPPGLLLDDGLDLWLSLRLDEDEAPRGFHFLTTIGRLRSDVELADARTRSATIAAALAEESGKDHGVRLEPLHDELAAEAGPTLLLLLGAVACVLLIACGNVANLLLVRAADRRREMAVRLSLGGDRRRLLRQVLTESAVLGLAGGLVGLLLAWWSIEALAGSAAGELPRAGEAGMNLTVLVFALGLSLVTSLVFGAVPALRAARIAPAGVLRAGGPGRGGARHGRLGPALVVAEVALSLVLLAGAGLLVRSLLAAVATDPGFEPRGVLALELQLPDARYPETAQQDAFYRSLGERIARLPGVERMAEVSHLPLGGDNTNGSFQIEGREWPEGESPLVDKRLAGPGYFATLGIPVLQGRGFSDHDRAGGAPVAVINRALADRYFPGENPVGRRIDFDWGTDGWQEIVGVVGDVRHQGLDQPVRPELYLPFAQNPQVAGRIGRIVVVRTAGDPARLMPAVREQVFAVDPEQPVASLDSVESLVGRSLAERRLATTLLGGLGGVALLLAAIGLYGVVSYLVRLRTHEIGVRIAIGATPGDVQRRVLGSGLTMVGVGGALGLAGALVASRFLGTFLYGIGGSDPWAFTAAVVGLLAAAAVACALPARRAARTDPMAVLRME